MQSEGDIIPVRIGGIIPVKIGANTTEKSNKKKAENDSFQQ